MMAYEKPKMCEEVRRRLNELVPLLKQKRLTKPQIMEMYNCNERTAREMISIIAKKFPVVATSDKEGYKIATTAADKKEVEHTWAELSSRNEEIKARIEPLISFREKFGG
jgi:hypothetical protein